MDRQTIIDKLVNDETYKVICKRIAGEYADDLYQEIILVMLEMPEDKLLKLANTCLMCFFYRAAQRQFCSKSSKFYRTYLRENELIATKGREILQVQESTFDEELMDKVDTVMAGLDEYDRDVLSLYAEKGTIREVSELTGIPAGSLQNTVRRTKSLIQKKVRKHE